SFFLDVLLVFRFRLLLLLVFHLPRAVFNVLYRLLAGVFQFAHAFLQLALHFLASSLELLLGVAGPLAGLALDAAGNVFHLAFHLVLIHFLPSLGKIKDSGARERLLSFNRHTTRLPVSNWKMSAI